MDRMNGARKEEPASVDPERRYVERVKEEIRRFLVHRGIEARVVDKVNRHGDTVIGVILPGSLPY